MERCNPIYQHRLSNLILGVAIISSELLSALAGVNQSIPPETQGLTAQGNQMNIIRNLTIITVFYFVYVCFENPHWKKYKNNFGCKIYIYKKK